MRWDCMFVFFVMIALTVLDAESKKNLRKEIIDLTTRVEKLEGKQGGEVGCRRRQPGDPSSRPNFRIDK